MLRAVPEKVYHPDAAAKWLPPNGFTGKVNQMTPRVGGTYRTVGRMESCALSIPSIIRGKMPALASIRRFRGSHRIFEVLCCNYGGERRGRENCCHNGDAL